MATISFTNLDQAFSVFDVHTGSYFGQDTAIAGFEYSFLTNWPHDWEFDGAGVVVSGGLMTAGVINGMQVDLDNDFETLPEITITGLGAVAATSFGIGVGSVAEQRDAFWKAALGGDDTFTFTMADYAVALNLAGDGAGVSSGMHFGGEDAFQTGGVMLTGDGVVAGDYLSVSGGTAIGGYDQFTVGAKRIVGDFYSVGGTATTTGAGDSITPGILDDVSGDIIMIAGDAYFVSGGTFSGGADFIDLSGTDVSGIATTVIYIVGDVVDASGGSVAGSNDTVYGSSRGDAVWGDYNSATIAVTGGADALYGRGGADTLQGQEGDDVIQGGAGADNLDGGAGSNDWVYYDDAVAAGVDLNLQLNLVSGDAVATGDLIAGFEHAIGSSFADTLTGANGVGNGLYGGDDGDVIAGLSGADFLGGDAGADTLAGGDDNDTLRGGAGADSMDGGAGAGDYLYYDDAATGVTVNLALNTVSGDAVASGDTIAGFEHVIAGDGADSLTGDGQANYLSSANGSDTMFGGAGADTLSGGFSGADSLYGEGGGDQIYADAAGGFADGGADNDFLFGDAGNDTMKGGAGADSLVGGNGVDTLDYSDATTKVTVRLWNQTASGDVATGDTISGFESARGGSGGDAIVGSDAVNNRLVGNGGADNIQGLSGNDTLEGNAGNDTLKGGIGADVMSGGADSDTLDYSDSSSGVKVRLWNQTVTDGLATGDTIAGMESAIGGSSTDALVGSFGVANYLSGNGGNDNIQGLSGNDTLVGGVGKDTLTGGDDADTFVFKGAWGIDRITDFQGGAGAGDVLSFEGLGAAFDTFAEILAITTQSGANTIINFGGGQTITLLGFNMANLAADDFAFG